MMAHLTTMTLVFFVSWCPVASQEEAAGMALEVPATVLIDRSHPHIGYTSCGSGSDISIPTRGSDHDEWAFDVSCYKVATGIQGTSNVPSGHSVSFVAGFRLHCEHGYNSENSAHWLHDGGDISWNVDLSEPLVRVTGCINRPAGHHITYWSSATFTGISGWRSGSVGTNGDSCDSDSEEYDISCPTGYCMKRFQGYLDVPDGHAIRYVACLNIYCGICPDGRK